jgi:hypothetical protein
MPRLEGGARGGVVAAAARPPGRIGDWVSVGTALCEGRAASMTMGASPCPSLPGLTSPGLTRGPIHPFSKNVLRRRWTPGASG